MGLVRRFLRRVKERFVRILHLDDSTHRIALGAALGMFISLTPTVGFHMLLVILVTLFIRANRLAGLTFVWFTNPAVLVPAFYFNYRVGVWLLGETEKESVYRDWVRVSDTLPGLSLLFGSPAAWWSDLGGWLGSCWQATTEILAPLWAGSLVVGAASAVITYVAMYYLVISYRRRLKPRLHELVEHHHLHHGVHGGAVAAERHQGDGAPPAA